MKRPLFFTIPLIILSLILSACSLPSTPASTLAPTPTPIPSAIPTDLPATETAVASASLVPPTVIPTVTAVTTAASSKVMPVLGTKTLKEKNDKKKYDIDIEYPLMQGKAAQVDPFNQEMNDFITQTVNGFKNDLASYSDTSAGDSNNSLQLRFTTPLVSDQVVSILFQAYFYYAGAAHPNTYYVAYNYDLTQNKMLELNDLFLPNSNALSIISFYCQVHLEKNLGDSYVKEGATAIEDNYKNWNIKLDGLQFTFDPYQVAPYAAGPQTIVVPFSVLEKIVAPDSVLIQNK
jgi:hypothetical protein